MEEKYISFGAIKSPLDYRDIGLSQISPIRKYPASFFNNLSKASVWYQRRIGACVGHAFAKYKQVVDIYDINYSSDLSARFLYAIAKCRDGVTDEGTFPRLVAKILKDIGCATEKTCPNDTTLDHETYVFNRKEENITKEMLEEAKLAKISGYAFTDMTNEGLKQAIVDFKGCALLLRLGNEWWTNKFGYNTWDGNEILPVKPPKVIISGHEVYLYGYEDIEGDTRFWFRNSFSNEWGAKGDGYFMWSQYKDFLDEGITVVDIPNHLLEEVHNLPGSFTHAFNTPLAYGDESEEVKWLQRALKVAGYFTGSITGGYYNITRKAVFEYQKRYVKLSSYERHFLKGFKVGKKTLIALNNQFNK